MDSEAVDGTMILQVSLEFFIDVFSTNIGVKDFDNGLQVIVDEGFVLDISLKSFTLGMEQEQVSELGVIISECDEVTFSSFRFDVAGPQTSE